jgi:hypothetical protein
MGIRVPRGIMPDARRQELATLSEVRRQERTPVKTVEKWNIVKRSRGRPWRGHSLAATPSAIRIDLLSGRDTRHRRD